MNENPAVAALFAQRLAPYVPEPIKEGGEKLTFARSKRTYVLSKVESDLREAKKRDLYASMSNPAAAVAKPGPDSTVSPSAENVCRGHSLVHDMIRDE